MSKERSKGLPQTLRGGGGGGDDDTMEFERPIVENLKRLIERENMVRNEYLEKKLQYIQESNEQEKEELHIKVERVRVDKERIGVGKEMLHIENIKEDERIMMKDTINMFEKQNFFNEKL